MPIKPRGDIKISRLKQRALVTDFQQLTSTGTIQAAFEVLDDEPFDYEPGQFVAIDFDHPEHGYCRSPYCICSPPKGRTFELLVRVVEDGPVSLFINDLEIGDFISFRGPSGFSMMPMQKDIDLVLMATGVGISPFYPLIEALFDEGYARPITLYWGLRLVGDICFTEKLDELANTHSNFTYHITLSQPPGFWQGLRGRVSESVPPLLKTIQDKHFILSGNDAMIAEMSDVLAEVGVLKSRIFEEVFFNLRHRPAPKIIEAISARFVARDIHGLSDCVRELLEG